MKHLIIFLFLGLQFSICAQPDPNSEALQDAFYVYLYNGSLIQGNEVLYFDKFIGKDYMSVDGQKIELNQVKFYKNQYGFYANPKGYIWTNEFMPRISAGRINLFELERINNAPTYNAITGFSQNYSKRIDTYYNVGFGNLKKATYDNLQFDLKDSPEAMLYLDNYKKSTNVQIGLYVAGGAMVVGGLLAFVNNPQSNTAPILLMGGGAVTGWVAYFIGLDKPRHLKDAVDAYNRF
jgi:hypothetical protein